MLEVPEGSIYYWMYIQGLKHVDFKDVVVSVLAAGKEIRPKDETNYWNGWYNSDRDDPASAFKFKAESLERRTKWYEMEYHDFPVHPYAGFPEIENRWVPCDKDNHPMVKWKYTTNRMMRADAEALRHCKYVGENLCGTQMIVIDCDGDHGDKLDMETIRFLGRYIPFTHTLSKPKKIGEYYDPPLTHGFENNMSASFHLTFMVDRIIPTMHFNKSHIDIVGNKANSLRYIKNKVWNGKQAAWMNDDVWHDIMSYVRYREEH